MKKYLMFLVSIFSILFLCNIDIVRADTLTRDLSSFAYLRKAIEDDSIVKRTPTSENTYNDLNFNNNLNSYIFSSLSLANSSFALNDVWYDARVSNIYLNSYVLASQCSNNCDLPISFNLQWNAEVSKSTTNEQKLLTEIQWFLNNYNNVYIVFTDNNDKVWRTKLNTQVLQSNQYEESNRLYYYLNIYYTLTLYDVKYINYIDIEFPLSAYQEQVDATSSNSVDWTNTYLTFNTFAYSYNAYSGGTNGTDGTDSDDDVIGQLQQETNEKLDSLNSTMSDDSAVPTSEVSDKTSEWSDKLAGTGPVSQMVLMPITLLNGYVSGFNSTCTPYNLGSLYGTDVVLPCINISNYLGATLWGVIDVLFSGFMIYALGKKFVKIFNDFTNLRDNQMDELYGGGK